MKCPIDATELRITQRNGIEIDYCPQCRGIWLDRGELDKLIDRSITEERQDYSAYAGQIPGDRVKRKNDYDDQDDLFDQRDTGYATRPYDHSDDRRSSRHKKRSFLEDIFDIFD